MCVVLSDLAKKGKYHPITGVRRGGRGEWAAAVAWGFGGECRVSR